MNYINAIKILLTATFLAVVWVFFALAYKYHVQYHEQYQLFLYTSDYAVQVISRPGGVAEFISRFLVQFFYFAKWGAPILACLLVIMQLLTACAMRAKSILRYALSFVPAIAMWMALCDESTMPTACIALIFALIAFVSVRCLDTPWLRALVVMILTPGLYFLAGPMGLVFSLMAAANELSESHLPSQWIIAISYVAEAAVCPLVFQYLTPYTLERLYYGISYFRFPFVVPAAAWCASGALALLVCASILIPPRSSKWKWAAEATAVVAVTLFAVFGVRTSVNMDKEEVFGYDYMARHGQWNDIMLKALDKHPDKPLSVMALNLALAKRDVLGDYMFRFYQNGVEGLMPKFERDFTMPLVEAEVYYHLGMINSAQRLAFEAQEAIPDFQKSARCYKRLAETHIINGDYEAARKYLKTLQSTLIYKNWATQALALLHNEEAINNHPEYGHLRNLRYTTDIFYSEDELDNMFGRLFLDNRSNKMAFEYLLAHALLNRDLGRFYECYVLGKDLGYDHIPESYQEALALKWTTEHDSWQGLPWSLSPQVCQRMEQYIYDRRHNTPAMDAKYAGTYWNYYFK